MAIGLGYRVPVFLPRASCCSPTRAGRTWGDKELTPGTHRAEVPLPDEPRDSRGDVPTAQVVCAPPGSVLVFHHSAVAHGADAHNGERDRYSGQPVKTSTARPGEGRALPGQFA
jgi:ectoine hydroxylase